MRAQTYVPIYGLVALALYIVTTSDTYLSRGVEWFPYFVLIPVTIALAIIAFLNIRKERIAVRNV